MSKSVKLLLVAHFLLTVGVVALLVAQRSSAACDAAQTRATLAWQAVATAELSHAMVDTSYDPTTVNAVEVAAAHAAGETKLAKDRAERLPWTRPGPSELAAHVDQTESVLGDSARRLDLARQATDRAVTACE